MQYSLTSQLHCVSLKMSSQSMGNILLNLGKMGMQYENFSDNLKISIEVSIRKLLNGKMCKNYDLMQLVYGMYLTNFKWYNLSEKTKEALSTAIFLRSQHWAKQGQSSIIEFSIMLTYLHRLGVNWYDSLPTLKSGVLIGLASVTDSNSTEYLKWNKDDYIRLEKLKHGIVTSSFLSHRNTAEKIENTYLENRIVPYTIKDTENSFVSSIPLIWHSLAGFNISLTKDSNKASSTSTSSIPTSILCRFYDLTVVFMPDYSFRGYSMIVNSLFKMNTLPHATKFKIFSTVPKLFRKSFTRYFFLQLNHVRSSSVFVGLGADFISDGDGNDASTIKSVANMLKKMGDIGFQLNRYDPEHKHYQQILDRYILAQSSTYPDCSLDILSSSLYGLSSIGMKWVDLSDDLKVSISKSLSKLQLSAGDECSHGIRGATAAFFDTSNTYIAQILKTIATLEPTSNEKFGIRTSLERTVVATLKKLHSDDNQSAVATEEVKAISLVLFYTGKLFAKNILPLSFLEREISLESSHLAESGMLFSIRYVLFDIIRRYIPTMDSHMISNILNSLQNMNCFVISIPNELSDAIFDRMHRLLSLSAADDEYQSPKSVVSSLSALTNMGFNASHLSPLRLLLTEKIALCSCRMNSLESRIVLKIFSKLDWTEHLSKLNIVTDLFNNIWSELDSGSGGSQSRLSPTRDDSFTACALLRLMAEYNTTLADATNPAHKRHLMQFLVNSATKQQTSYYEYCSILNEMIQFNATWSQLGRHSHNCQEDIINKAITFIAQNNRKNSDFKISYTLLGKFIRLGLILNANNANFVNTMIEAACEYILRFPQYKRKLDELTAKKTVMNTNTVSPLYIIETTLSLPKLQSLLSDLSALGVDWDLLTDSSRRSVIHVISLALLETLDYLKDGIDEATAVERNLSSAQVYDVSITLFKCSLNILLHFDKEWSCFPTRPRNLLSLAFAKVLQYDNGSSSSINTSQTKIVIENMKFVLRTALLNKLNPSPSLVPKELRTLIF